MSDVRRFRQPRFAAPVGACEILLVRHGEAGPFGEDITHPFVGGQIDPALYDPDGFRQAEQVAERLVATGEPIAAIYVSTLRRTQQTAAPLAARLGIEPRVEPDLREVAIGEWEGLVPFKAADGDPIAVEMFEKQRWDVIPGAEPGDEFRARIVRGIERIAAAHPGELVAAFTHGGVINELVNVVVGTEGFGYMPDNASIQHLVVDGDRWILRCFNDTSHLSPTFSTAAEPVT